MKFLRKFVLSLHLPKTTNLIHLNCGGRVSSYFCFRLRDTKADRNLYW